MTTALLTALLLQSKFETKTYVVNGVKRVADIYAPSVPTAHPSLVFGFHGHGGNSKNAARSFQMHTVWPEAVVVYMQGLPTKVQRTDPEGLRAGWQISVGQNQNRDLEFFDAVFGDVTKRFGVNLDQVYAMGHSNGGRFTYLLMQQRGSLFAAFAPSGSPSPLMGMPSKPVFHVAGEQDPLVPFEGQSKTLDMIKKRNGCGTGVKTGQYTTLFKAEDGNDVVAYFHPGGHEYPRTDGPALIAEFFKAHSRH